MSRAAVRAIALGTLRWYLRLAPAVESLLAQPRGIPDEVRTLLVAAAHQIEYSRNVPQASVHAAVDSTRILGHGRATGLVNAVLRRFVAERAALLERLDASLSVRCAHPQWLVERLQRAWPAQCAAILAANNEHPPLVLRVDVSRRSIPAYLEELAAAGFAAAAIDWAPSAVRLERAAAVGALPGFAEGIVSVQDAGAQLAAVLLEAGAGMRVLDACAAPGGKTGHLLERTPELGELVAVDIDTARVERIAANLVRLRRHGRLVVADIRAPDTFWDGRPFERILVDAPCSSTGVIRRHPDIKLLRRSTDIPALAATQGAILRAAFRMLAPGGRLVYSTCSVLPVENEAVVEEFLQAEPAAAAITLSARLAPGAAERRVGIQLLPGAQAASDGFYYACLEKTTTGT